MNDLFHMDLFILIPFYQHNLQDTTALGINVVYMDVYTLIYP